MQFADLRRGLESEYSVTDIAWLEDLAHQPSNTLYSQWLPHLQAVYKSNQRFVLLNFRPVDTAILKHVAQLIEYLDISPCFVLLVTDQVETAEWFRKQSNNIQVELVNYTVLHTLPDPAVTPQFNTNNAMCAHAWTGVHVWPNGETSPCCEYSGTITDATDQPYNIKTHDLSQSTHSA